MATEPLAAIARVMIFAFFPSARDVFTGGLRFANQVSNVHSITFLKYYTIFDRIKDTKQNKVLYHFLYHFLYYFLYYFLCYFLYHFWLVDPLGKTAQLVALFAHEAEDFVRA